MELNLGLLMQGEIPCTEQRLRECVSKHITKRVTSPLFWCFVDWINIICYSMNMKNIVNKVLYVIPISGLAFSTIDFNLTPNPGNNYQISYYSIIGDSLPYNSNNVNYNSLDHTSHIFNFSYSSFSDYYHRSHCSCGDYILEAHTFTDPPIHALRWFCNKCGMYVPVSYGPQI